MNVNIVKMIINQVSIANVSFFEYTDKEVHIKMVKPQKPEATKSEVEEEIACSVKREIYQHIRSEYVGIFRSFISVGQSVKPGDLLCFIDYLDIEIQIKSEFSGDITEICVENGDLVDYGKILLEIISI